ncbi:hypothetical protein V1478_010107 [Vespula squamosa]|uniref:Uncharacterized protein n=1 Tax=Vespula squamosa TaxID=30214 RepID=A0ABD2AJF8_VESSQ
MDINLKEGILGDHMIHIINKGHVCTYRVFGLQFKYKKNFKTLLCRVIRADNSTSDVSLNYSGHVWKSIAR